MFLSDLHLGAGPDARQRQADLVALLEKLPGRVDDLVLGGDTFEFWWEWKHAVPSGFLDALEAVRKLSGTGVRVRFVAGNHDFAIGPVLAGFCHAAVHPDGVCLDILGRRWLMVHGDATPPSERVDRLVRSLLRSRWARAAWNTIPVDIAFPLALGVGEGTRRIEPGPAPSTREMEPMARAWMTRFGLDGVVHGHTHRPLVTQGPEGIYANNGDWMRRRDAIFVDEHGARLVDFRHEEIPWRSGT